MKRKILLILPLLFVFIACSGNDEIEPPSQPPITELSIHDKVFIYELETQLGYALELENISMIGGLVIVDRPYIDLDPTFPSSKIILTIFLLINVFINIPFILFSDRLKKG